ncbi:MAG: DNA-binding transcriptional regulator [Myxococcales bacterium]|nr:DNA-binding transcriptional regulator [Myxococcales bacterium]
MHRDTSLSRAEPDLPADLVAVLAHLEQPAAIQALLGDLLTPAETEALTERWAIVKRLRAGESQRAVRDAVGCSITTVGRGSRQLQYGRGGFVQAFAALQALGLPGPAGEAP